MTVRRFLCPGSGCPRRIFVEPLDGFAARYARTTTRLARAHLAIGSALGRRGRRQAGGEARRADQPRYLAASRQASGGSIAASPRDSSASTTGPGARGNATAPSSSTSRRARSSTSCPTATPRPSRPGSRPIPASSWSAAIARRPTPRRPPRPRPQAQQVADRWHLLKNVREAIERLLERHLPIITEALKPADPDPGKGGSIAG